MSQSIQSLTNEFVANVDESKGGGQAKLVYNRWVYNLSPVIRKERPETFFTETVVKRKQIPKLFSDPKRYDRRRK